MTDVPGTAGPVSERVLDAVATEEGRGPLDLERPLNDVVDPDALDRLFRTNGGPGRDGDLAIDFAYGGAHVHLDADGPVCAESADDAPEE